MNRHRFRVASHDLLGGIGFAAFALFLALPHCAPPLPPEPPYVVTGGDASDLLDVGSSPSDCQLVCANFAAIACREALGTCVPACEMARVKGILHDETIGCLKAAHDRNAMHFCGTFCP